MARFLEITPRANLANYIETSDTQYIDTGIVPGANTRVVSDIQNTDTSTATYVYNNGTGSVTGG